MVRVDHVTHCLRYGRSKYREYVGLFVLCYFVMTVYWSLLKQQDLDTVIIIIVSLQYVLTSSFPAVFRLLGYVVLGSCDTGDQTTIFGAKDDNF